MARRRGAYVPQRQILVMFASMSASVGLAKAFKNAATAMICPDFDGDDLRAIESADRHRTGAHGGAVDMHRASAALCDTASEFCTRQTDHVAQHPEKRRIGLYVDLPRYSVDVNRDHRGSPPALRNRPARSAGVYCELPGNAVTVEPTASTASDRPATRA